MSNQQKQHQYYEGDHNMSAQDEVDAMLNSLVGQTRPGGSYNNNPSYAEQQQYNNNYYNYYPPQNNNIGPPPALPPRTDSNSNNVVEGSNKYYYPPENNYGYPPPQDNSYPLPATPLPQRVSSVTADSYPPNNDGYPMQMPVPQYQHHYHQRHASNNSIDQTSVYPPQQYNNGTPPGSPGMNHAVYPPVGYPDATQDLINNSYRPTFVSHASDASTPTVSGKPTPPLPAASGFRPQPSASTHRRTHSSLRNNMIMTIERPRYTYLPETDSTNGEVPFIPVSPDTDSEEEEEYFTTHRVNEHSPVEPPVTLDPVIIQPQDVQYVDPSAQEVAALEQHVGQLQLENEARQFQAVEPEAEEALLMPEERKPAEPNYGLLSLLSIQFIRAVKGLENVRELWCASEYNESFTGSEAVTIIRNLLKDQVPDDYCILVASALMRSDPALFSPTQYSQKSLISNTVNADDTYFLEEDISDDYTPIGVLPSLTPCYSYTCRPGMGGCYSESCPNTGKDFFVNTKVETTTHTLASHHTTSSPVGGWLVSHEAWAARMDPEFLKSLDSKEIGRQEVINETIYSEEKYLADLTILHEVVVKGIEDSGVIEPDRVSTFISTVFNNYQELLQMSDSLFKDMLVRYHQHDCECVPTIGDILVQHMQFFEEAYVKYSPHALLAKYLAEVEIKQNPDFEKFTKELAKHERANRLPIWHYLLSPVTRMQRYPLIIEALLKKTPQDHPDHVFLTRSYDIIRSVATKADNTANHIKKRLAILHIRDSISFKQGEPYDLQLNDPNRRLYHKGILKRRSGAVDVDKNDVFAFVFDHMLVMTKVRKTSAGEEYRIWRKPIPLQLLVVQNNANNMRFQMTGTTNSYTIPGGVGTTLILHHLGSRGGSVYPFFCSSLEEKQEWTKAIDDAKASIKKRQGDSDVFELKPLDDVNFRNIGSGQSTGTTTRVNCSVPFVSSNEEKKIAIGTDNGVFFKTEGQDNSVRRIIQCESVLQLAVMEQFHILIVLTDKALRAYPVDALDSKSNTRAIDRIEVEIAQHVNFFQIGVCNGRAMLVFKKKRNTTSVFTALEPFCDLRDPKNEKLLTQRPSIFSNRPEYLRWFKKYKEFYVGADSINIHFLKSKLNVVCERGFELIDPENLTVNREIPDSGNPEFNFVVRHTELLKPLAMYRINDKFLLCYDKFAFYVNNRNGSLVPRADRRHPPTVCDWEGTPAHTVYAHPYIIGIDPYFIEIRRVDNGELVQIISGENIRLAYYNGGTDKPVIHVCMSHSQKPDTQALFQLVLNNHRNSSGYPRR